MPPPFVWLRGQLWVVSNWSCEMPADAWLLLRPATEVENDNYYRRINEAEVEAYYTTILKAEDRTSGR